MKRRRDTKESVVILHTKIVPDASLAVPGALSRREGENAPAAKCGGMAALRGTAPRRTVPKTVVLLLHQRAGWSGRRDLHPDRSRHRRRCCCYTTNLKLVSTEGFEPSATCSQGKRSTKLNYVKIKGRYPTARRRRVLPLPLDLHQPLRRLLRPMRAGWNRL